MNSLENEEREQLRNRIHPIVYNPRPGDGKVLVLVPTTYQHAYLGTILGVVSWREALEVQEQDSSHNY